MRGSAYLMIITLLLLGATALLIGTVSYGFLASSREALRQTIRKEPTQEAIFNHEREVPMGSFQEKVRHMVKRGKTSLQLVREVYAKGEVPLSLFPDLLLEELPSPRDLLEFLGSFQVEDCGGYFLLRGRRKALYFPFSVRIKTGRVLEVNGKTYRKLPVVVDGDCFLQGSGSIYLLCAGRVYIRASGGLKVVASPGGGFLKEGLYQSRIVVEGKFLEGELLAEEIYFKGHGTFKGSLQALRARGNWLHIKRGMILEDFPKIFYFSYRFCYRESKQVEVEE